MKCKNCGAHYKTRELMCPYCQTENIIGKIWMSQITDAEREYENARKEAGKSVFSPYVLERILTRILVVIVGLGFLYFVGVFLFFAGQEGFQKAYNSIFHKKVATTMEAYYEAGDLEGLDQYMDKHGLSGEDYFIYTQATLLNYDYNQYLTHKLQFMDLTEEEKEKDDFYLEYTIKYAHDVLSVDLGLYKRLDPTNIPLHDKYCEKIEAFLVGTLQLSEKQMETLRSSEYIYSDEMAAIVDYAKERKGWQ